MKKIITILLLSIVTTTYSQSKDMNFLAVATEMHLKNSKDEWYLYQKNGKTNITVKIEKDVLSIYAESPSMYRLDGKNIVDIDTKSFVGVSFMAKELKKDLKCRVDMLKHKESDLWILAIFYDDINLRYTLEEN
jgi:hypothetical protein